ncbi:MAG: NADP-dependent oxidoreductase [Bryobacterales bacterium]|nr:NADP-dependent oxidoreductase [Bryobacterales bacterium]
MNHQVTLAHRPVALPMESDFALVESPAPEAGEGQFLVRTLYLSLDPYMRGWIRENPGYTAPMPLGAVMPGGVVGVVEDSRHPGFQPGDIVEGMLGWRRYGVTDGAGFRKVDPSLAPISTALGLLGMPGLTAYFGATAIAQTKPGEQVFVSGAAGAVGSVAGQIGKILGCYVAGSAGSDDKVRHVLEDLGFDAAFNYRGREDYPAALREVCPKGIDVYFDNVDGLMTDAAVAHMNLRGRIAVCGQISQYNLKEPELGPRWLFQTIVKRLRIEGFLIPDFAPRIPEALAQMAAWYKEGRFQYRETIADGLENAPAAFIGMLTGRNTGKQLVKVTEL